MTPKTEPTTVRRTLARTATPPAREATLDRQFESLARWFETRDTGLLASVLLSALFAAYAAAVVPTAVTLLFGGFALAVAAVAALPFAVVRAVTAALARAE